jgi:hypothetical protein
LLRVLSVCPTLSVGSSYGGKRPTTRSTGPGRGGHTKRGAYVQPATVSIIIARADDPCDSDGISAACIRRRAGAAAASTFENASAESGPSGKADRYAGAGKNGDGRPHSLRQPEAGHESAQEPGRGNHGAGWDAVHRAGRQPFRHRPVGDNYFELYINGQLIGVDATPYTPFNSHVVRFRVKQPYTIAVLAQDWEDKLGLGMEVFQGNPWHSGDGGFVAKFSDGTVTDSTWKAQSFYIAPLQHPDDVVEYGNIHDTSHLGGRIHPLGSCRPAGSIVLRSTIRSRTAG